ncbi:HNH endonuclease [bacterium]|nr:HNH endonuclease [bacterium]
MIMDLPEKFSIGDARQKNDAFIEDGILKIRKNASYRFVIFELTFELKGGKHICRYCGKIFSDRKMTMDHMYPQDMGGPTITNNLLPSCQKCNSEKSDMTREQYEKYKHLEIVGKNCKEYLKDLRGYKEFIKKWEEFEIPKEWISQRELSTIIAEIRLDDCTQNAKYKKVEEFYAQYKHIQKPIIVDKNGFLLDGFYSVIFAKNNLIASLPAIELENVEVIM